MTYINFLFSLCNQNLVYNCLTLSSFIRYFPVLNADGVVNISFSYNLPVFLSLNKGLIRPNIVWQLSLKVIMFDYFQNETYAQQSDNQLKNT